MGYYPKYSFELTVNKNQNRKRSVKTSLFQVSKTLGTVPFKSQNQNQTEPKSLIQITKTEQNHNTMREFMSKTDLIVNFKTQTNKQKEESKRKRKENLAVNNDPAIVFGIMLGGFLHRVKLCKGRHA